MVSLTEAVITAPSLAEEPIRAELFGAERLEQHARILAAADRTTEKAMRGRNLPARVGENRRALLDAYHSIVGAVGDKHEITLAEEWFLDNFHVVDEQLLGIRDHLPKSYYHRLPKIVSERLGHATVAITLDRYSHLLPGLQEDAAAKVDSVLRASLAGD